MKIITHPGAAHRDEFLACCILAAVRPVTVIERRDATREELTDQTVYVIDQGRAHQPENFLFDHHQDERDDAPRCSVTLILDHLGVDLAEARDIFSWLEMTEVLDAKGPFAAAKLAGTDREGFEKTLSPIEATVLRWFGSKDRVEEDHPLFHLMTRIGSEKLSYLALISDRLEALKSAATTIVVDGVKVLDATFIERGENPVLGLEIFCLRSAPDVVVTITQDDRGGGLCLFRRGPDNSVVDFSRVDGLDGAVFAHKGGFVAKLARGVDPVPMIRQAVIARAVLA